MTIVICGGTLIDGTGQAPLPDSIIVIEGDSIAAVGPAVSVTWPDEAQIIDATGKTVLPGFIDCHAHLIAYEYNLEKRLATPASYRILKTTENLRATLEAGVTTVREAGGVDAGVKLAIEQGLISGPRLLVSIIILGQRGALWDLPLGAGATLDMTGIIGEVIRYGGGVEMMRQAVRHLVLAGADVINIYTTGSIHKTPGRLPAAMLTPAEIEAVVYEARAAGKRVMAHVDGGPGVANAIRAGVDSIEHPYFLSEEDIALLLETGAFLVPTLACNYGILKIAGQDPAAGVHEQAIEGAKKFIPLHTDSFQRAATAGVKIAMGSDSFGRFQGDNLLELELMVNAGFSPMQAIVAGTYVAATCLGVEERLGTLTPGKLADLLVVEGDPLANIKLLQHRENLLLIMKGGEIFKDYLSK